MSSAGPASTRRTRGRPDVEILDSGPAARGPRSGAVPALVRRVGRRLRRWAPVRGVTRAARRAAQARRTRAPEAGRRSHPRRLAVLASLAVLAAAVPAVLAESAYLSGLDRARAPGASGSPGGSALDLVVAQAALPGPWTDTVRPESSAGTCRQPRAGYAPRQAVGAALGRELAGFTVADASQLFDQAGALCAVDVRARDGAGTTVLVQVSSPAALGGGRWGAPVVQARTVGPTETTSVTVELRTGWTIHAGATGPAAAHPSADRLRRLVLDPDLTW